MVNVCKKNMVLQIEHGNLRSLKTIRLCILTIEQGNLWNQAQTHTHSVRIWFCRTSWHCTNKREQVQLCNRRGEHRLQHPRCAEFDGETITWRQRSKLDSEDRGPPSTTSTSKWSSTTSTTQSVQQRVKRCDYGCGEHWTMRDSQRGAEITVQSMPDVLGRWHRLFCTCGHFLRDDSTETRSTSRPCWISSLSRTFTSGRAGHTVTGTGRKVLKNTTLRINSKRSVRNDNSWAFTIGSFVIHGSERLCSNWVALKKWSVRWTDWRTKTTPIFPQEELDVYRGNRWIRSNLVGSDTMTVRHRPDFKKAVSTLHRLKKAEDKAHHENWSKSSSSWWQW